MPRPAALQHCPQGVGIYPQLNRGLRHEWNKVGPCDVCGVGPLHAVQNTCRCAFLRHGHRVCRLCAIALDLTTRGSTLIEDPPISNTDWLRAELIRKRGIEAQRVLL